MGGRWGRFPIGGGNDGKWGAGMTEVEGGDDGSGDARAMVEKRARVRGSEWSVDGGGAGYVEVGGTLG